MKQLSTIATALLISSGVAQASSAASQDVLLKTAGYWSAYYTPTDNKGNPMCRMQGNVKSGETYMGGVYVKYAPGGQMFVQLYKMNWALPKGSRAPLTMQFDNAAPLTVNAIGLNYPQLPGSYLEFEIATDFTKDFLLLFATANQMVLTFPQGTERPWVMNMEGSSEAMQAFSTCVASIPRPTQPYGTQPTQPSGTTVIPKAVPAVPAARPKGETII